MVVNNPGQNILSKVYVHPRCALFSNILGFPEILRNPKGIILISYHGDIIMLVYRYYNSTVIAKYCIVWYYISMIVLSD